MKKNKKSNIIINILIVVVILGGASIFWYMQRTVPYWQCSEVYKRYKDVEGVRATYIKDFRVNDTLTIGVTLLEATTDSGWVFMTKEFNLSDEMLVVLEKLGMLVWKSPRGNLGIMGAADGVERDMGLQDDNMEIWVCSYCKKEFCIFHTLSRQEIEAVLNYNYDIMIENKQ